MEGINETYGFINAPAPDFAALKKNIRNAAGKEKKAARKALKDAKHLMVEKDAARYLTDELNKFQSPKMQLKLSFAQKPADVKIGRLSDTGIPSSAKRRRCPPPANRKRKNAPTISGRAKKF